MSANDPVYLNRPLHVLECMHAGGWTAVVDASKFFYQFPTHPEDRPYLGVVHPTTGQMCTWDALPMGAANSPACAGRHGMAFLRLYRETHQPDPRYMLRTRPGSVPNPAEGIHLFFAHPEGSV